MSFSTPVSMPSGLPLAVTEVEGRRPAALEDFVGDVGFVVADAAHSHVHGCGRVVEDTVRFHEKDVAANGRDVRVWTVRRQDEEFFAEQTAAF